ncbi:MAG: peroxiredoxin [Spirochaetales bacterium]|nr:peroxiredoxin [Spirochaetales bacterium]
MSNKLSLPALGEKFPHLEVSTSQGAKVLPEDYNGKWFVLFSHPGDFTPVCTTEFESFAMHEKEFHDLNCELIGLSLDSVEEHKNWISWINENAPAPINYPVIGDESAIEVANTLGMVHSALGNASIRAVFIVDDKGFLRLMMYYPMVIGRNISEIVRSVKALQIFDKEKVLLPADYPNNKWLGDSKALLISPQNEEMQTQYEAAKEAGKINSKADWFWFKDMK